MSAPILGDSCSATQSKKNQSSIVYHYNPPYQQTQYTHTLSVSPHVLPGKAQKQGNEGSKPKSHTKTFHAHMVVVRWSFYLISKIHVCCTRQPDSGNLPDFWEIKIERDTETEIWCAGLKGNLQATRNATTNLRNDFTHATGQTPSIIYSFEYTEYM